MVLDTTHLCSVMLVPCSTEVSRSNIGAPAAVSRDMMSALTEEIQGDPESIITKSAPCEDIDHAAEQKGKCSTNKDKLLLLGTKDEEELALQLQLLVDRVSVPLLDFVVKFGRSQRKIGPVHLLFSRVLHEAQLYWSFSDLQL